MTSLQEINKYNIKSDEEALDVIALHLITQGEQSIMYGGDCAYRGMTPEVYDEFDELIEGGQFNGMCCAVGAIIKDSAYDSTYESLGVDEQFVQSMIKKSHPEWDLTDQSIKLLTFLQRVHDRIDEHVWGIVLNTFINSCYRSHFYESASDTDEVANYILAKAFNDLTFLSFKPTSLNTTGLYELNLNAKESLIKSINERMKQREENK